MSFVKLLAQKILENNVRKLEGPDIWRLYNLVHLYKTCVGKTTQYHEANLPDQEVTLTEQYNIVHENIQQQVGTLVAVPGTNKCMEISYFVASFKL